MLIDHWSPVSPQVHSQEPFSAILSNRCILTIYSPYTLEILVDYFRLFAGSSSCRWSQLSLGLHTYYCTALNSWNWTFVFIYMLGFAFLWLLSTVLVSLFCGFFCGTTESFSDVNPLTNLPQKTFSLKQCLALVLLIFLLWDMGGRALVDKIHHKVGEFMLVNVKYLLMLAFLKLRPHFILELKYKSFKSHVCGS